MKILDRLNSSDLNALKLKNTTFRKSTDTDVISKVLFQLYNSKNSSGKPHIANQFLASILDACCTQLITEFLFSRQILEELLKNNKNIVRSTCSGLEYKLFMQDMISNNILEIIDKPTIYNKQRGKAGKYKILYDEIIDYVRQKNENFVKNAQKESEDLLFASQIKNTQIEKKENLTNLKEKPDHLENCECTECVDYNISSIIQKSVKDVTSEIFYE